MCVSEPHIFSPSISDLMSKTLQAINETWLRDLLEIIQQFHSINSSESFRSINSDEISLLQSQGNSSSNWSLIYVPKIERKSRIQSQDEESNEQFDEYEHFSFDTIHHCHFDGIIIFLSSFTTSCKISIGKGIHLSSGLYQTTFSGLCFLGKDCLVRNSQCVNNVFMS